MKSGAKRLPRCLGHFEEMDRQCDGNPVGKTDEDRAPCAFRDRCKALQQLTQESGKPIDYYLFWEGTTNPYAFAQDGAALFPELNRQIVKWAIRDGRVTNRTGNPVLEVVPKKPLPRTEKQLKALAKARIKAGRTSIHVQEARRERSRALVVWFVARLSATLGRPIAPSQAEAEPGELFVLKSDDDVTKVFAKRVGGRTPILNVRPRVMRVAVDIRVASGTGGNLSGVPGFEDYTGKEGHFRARFAKAGKREASMLLEKLEIE